MDKAFTHVESDSDCSGVLRWCIQSGGEGGLTTNLIDRVVPWLRRIRNPGDRRLGKALCG